MMFSLLLQLQIMNENLNIFTMMYRMAMPNGIDCCNNQTLLICVATIPFDLDGIELLYLMNCCVRYIIF